MPGLRAELAPVRHACTLRHLRALDGDAARGRTPVRGDAAAVRDAVLAHEARLETSLAAAALAAQSGPLAALLASMSAAVAQQLAADRMSLVDALQVALAAEHAALHVYGTLGARTSASATPALYAGSGGVRRAPHAP